MSTSASPGFSHSAIVDEALTRSAKISKVILNISRNLEPDSHLDAIWQRLHSGELNNDSIDNPEPFEDAPTRNFPKSRVPTSPVNSRTIPEQGRNREFISEVPKFQTRSEKFQNQPYVTNSITSNIESIYDPSFTITENSISSSLLKGPRTYGRSDLFRSKRESHGINRAQGSSMPLRNASEPKGSVLCEMDALTLRNCVISSELFGVGLQVSTEVPHIVQNVSQVVYADNQYQNGERQCIQPGDQLVGVGGSAAQSFSIEMIEQLICGQRDSRVTLAFQTTEGRLYEVDVVRHIPIRQYEKIKSWYDLKDGITSLSSDISIVRHLEDVRALVCEHGDGPVDLLKAEQHGTASLGFTIAFAEPTEQGSSAEQGSFFVQKVIPGTSAHLDGRLLPGDEIVAIGGELLKGSYESALEILKRPAAVGSMCAVRYKRNGIISEVEVYRSPLSFVEESELLFVLLEHHIQAVEKEAASSASLVGSLQLFAESLLLSQRNRLEHERALSRRLLGFQEDVLRLVTEAEKCLKPGLENAPLSPADTRAQDRRSPVPEPARPEPARPEPAQAALDSAAVSMETEKQRRREAEAEAARLVLTKEAESLRAEIAQKTELIGLQAQELKRLRPHAESSPSVSLHSTHTALLERSFERSPRPGPGPSESFSAASVASPYAEAAARAPVMLPPSGRYTRKVDVTVVSDVLGARLFCTRDNTTPSPSNYAACGPSPLRIELRHSAVLKCVAVPPHAGSAAAREAVVCRQEYVVEPGPVTAESPPPGQASRPPTRSTPPSTTAATESAAAGVGVLLEISDAAGRPGPGPLFTVKRLVPHGPAALDGKVEVGDVLEQVDGVTVRSRTLNEVLGLIKGPEGTLVRLVLTRGAHGLSPAGPVTYVAALKRAFLPVLS